MTNAWGSSWGVAWGGSWNGGGVVVARPAAYPTALYYRNPDGSIARFPLQFKQGTTGPVTFVLLGADDVPQDLTGASSVRLTITRANGVKIIDARALTVATDPTTGRATWTRTADDTAIDGGYGMEVRVVRSDGTIGKFPDPDASKLVITPSPTL